MRFAIQYRCAYGYEQPVSDQHNAVRVQPAETPTQRVDSYELTVTPRARQFNYRDYFGTESLTTALAPTTAPSPIVSGSSPRLRITDPAQSIAWSSITKPPKWSV